MPRKKITQSTKTRNKKIRTNRTDFIDSKSIKDMFSKKVINHIAIATGFIQRQRKLNVYEFFFFNLWFVKNGQREFNLLS